MSDTETHDVAIVGGGLVGPVLALALAEIGLSVAVIDRLAEPVRRDPQFDGRAYAVSLGSERVLAAIGLWEGLRERAQPMRDIRVGEGTPGRSPRGLLHFDPRAMAEGRVGWFLEDRWLRLALLDALERASGIRHIAPATVVERTSDGGRDRLGLDTGETMRAQLTVAADGRGSGIARLAGIRRIGWSYGQTGLTAAIEHEHPHDGLAWQSFFPGGPFAVLPIPGKRSSLVWSERTAAAERIAAMDDETYRAAVARRIGPRLGEIRLAGKRAAYPLSLSLAERYVAPRLALIGDAAHGVHPIAGQGMNMGLRDVAALAEVVTDAARRGEDIGAITVLERYQTWRRFDATALALGMDALNRLFSNDNPVLRAARRVGLAAVDGLGDLKRSFMREATGQAGEVPRLLRGEGL